MSGALKYGENIALIRAIHKELKSSIGISGTSKRHKQKATDDAAVQHMLGLMRENQLTERRFCRPQDHYKYFAETYLSYLKSSRLQDELTNKYFNKGDRSIEDSARMVGLELPKTMNNNNNIKSS